jgi:RNA polymerase sigma-70 factor, ECF subfamily
VRKAAAQLRDPDKAEDAVQDTLLAALGARERFAGGASVRTWLIGVLKHKIMDQFWRQWREVQLQDPEDVAETDDAPDEGDFASSGHWRNMG